MINNFYKNLLGAIVGVSLLAGAVGPAHVAKADGFLLKAEGALGGGFLGFSYGGGVGIGYQGVDWRFLTNVDIHSLAAGIFSVPLTLEFSYMIGEDFVFAPGMGMGVGILYLSAEKSNEYINYVTEEANGLLAGGPPPLKKSSSSVGVPLVEAYLTPKLGLEWHISQNITLAGDVKGFIVLPVVFLSYGMINVSGQFSF